VKALAAFWGWMFASDWDSQSLLGLIDASDDFDEMDELEESR